MGAEMKERVLGVDISLNHAAFLLLDHSWVSKFYFVTDRKKVVDLAKGKKVGAAYLSATKLKDKQQRDMLRVCFWNAYLAKLFDLLRPTYVGIEDYAYRATDTAYQLGEVGGAARYHAWRVGAKVRLHDPQSLKMYAVHNGTADAHETMVGVQERWPATKDLFDRYQSGKDQRTVEDLCDAFAMAQLVWLEVQLRDGREQLSKLHPKEVQLFNRCTKRYPTNILSREWLSRGE